MNAIRITRRRATGLLASLGLVPLARAGQYPDRFIRIINPFPPGGTGDLVIRLIAPALEARLGQRIVLESHSGAAGVIGTQYAAQCPPDGYTFIIGTTNVFVINQFVFSSMRVDPLKAFIPISRLVELPLVFFASASAPAANLNEYVAWAKAHPSQGTYATSGIGTTQHLAVEHLCQEAGIHLVHVPYQALGAALTAVIAGDVQICASSLASGFEHVRAGRLKALAVGGRSRMAELPDVPTVAESGFRTVDATNWFALAAPSGTPAAIVQSWSEELARVLSLPEIRTHLAKLGLAPAASGPAQTARELRQEAETWSRVVQTAGIKMH
jgi:tripartite-type tricarboxylate transporter receptor subunit TctC